MSPTEASVRFVSFPLSAPPSSMTFSVKAIFERNHRQISSKHNSLDSNSVLAVVKADLEGLGFLVESGKRAESRISVPVLYGENGVPEKTFDADAWHVSERYMIEVEAGRAYVNN